MATSNLLSQMSEFTSSVVNTIQQQSPALQQMESWTLSDNNSYFNQSQQQSLQSSSQQLQVHDVNYANLQEEDYKIIQELLQSLLMANHSEAVFELCEDERKFGLVLATYTEASSRIGFALTVLHQASNKDTQLIKAHCLLRSSQQDTIELRIACCGNVDAGKSTLLGVLTTGELDDGRGLARVHLFKHQHEVSTGRTSSVGTEIMGFTARGQHVIRAEQSAGSRKIQKLSWEEISERSAKVLSFLDLAGHEKYLKTTVFGMTGCSPDYVLLIIGANAGIIGMTKEHLGLALALNVPVLVAVTKIDMCPPNVLENTIKQLIKILKSSGCRKIPMFVDDPLQVIKTSKSFVSERVCPIFQISNVSGAGIDLLKSFLNLLPVYKNYNAEAPVEFQITDDFSVPGVGCVVSGTVLNGVVHVSDTLLLGPDTNGAFVPAQVKSIHKKRTPCQSAAAGSSACFALKKIKRSYIRKGMVMLARELKPVAVHEFEAEVLILYHSSTISERYQTMVHLGNIRQTAKIVCINETTAQLKDGEDSKENNRRVVRTGDRALVRFRFIKFPEYITVGTRLLFREGRTKGVGRVVKLFIQN